MPPSTAAIQRTSRSRSLAGAPARRTTKCSSPRMRRGRPASSTTCTSCHPDPHRHPPARCVAVVGTSRCSSVPPFASSSKRRAGYVPRALPPLPSATAPRPTFQIGERHIGGEAPPYLVAEAGVNHNGALDLALALVDAAADAGADAVKFQTFHADELASDDAPVAGYQRRAGGGASEREMLRSLA